MTPEQIMERINSRSNRIGEQPGMKPQTSLVDLAIGAPAPIATLPPAPSIKAESAALATEAAKPIVAAPATIPAPAATQPALPVSAPQPLRKPEVQAVVETLLLGPANIQTAQELFDKADQDYKRSLTDVSIEALSAVIFPGKKPEDPKRVAGNEEERSLAIQKLATTNARLITLSANRDAALRELQRERNQFEAAKLLAALLTSENKLL